MADENRSLQDLFASLRPAPNRTQSTDVRENPTPSSYSYPQSRPQSGNTAPFMTSSPSASFTSFSGATPSSASKQTNQTTTEHADRGANLLNLLRFNQPSQASGVQQAPPQQGSSAVRGPVSGQNPTAQNIHGRGISASDLVASYMGKPTISQSPGNATPSTMSESHSIQANPQDYLLQLLNRSSQSRVPTIRTQAQPASTDVDKLVQGFATSNIRESSPSVARKVSSDSSARRESPIRYFGTDESKEPTPFEPDVLPGIEKAKQEKPKIFPYVNPFEKLSASSPLKERSGNGTPVKETPPLSRLMSFDTNKPKEDLPTPGSVTPRTNLNENGQEILQSIERSASKDAKHGSQDSGYLVNIGAPTTDQGTVAQALNEVGEQVSRQVEYALSQQQPLDETEDHQVEEEVKDQLQDAAVEIKKELGEEGEMSTLKTLLPSDMAEEVKSIIDEAASGNVDGHHGSADDEESSGKGDEDIDVPVYNFPMRPFVSIDLQVTEPPQLTFRQSAVTDIARLKKEFDQVDRTLATASNNYIVYAMPRPGGFRVIRQEDGIDRQVFKQTKDQVFNVAISHAPSNSRSRRGLETCIATAISGTVYWVTLREEGKDLLKSDNFDSLTLVFPPVPAHDDNTSGGQLKTRAKKSNRHPEFFAIGRGKSIQIIFPLQAQSSKFVGEDHIVDTIGYYKERSLKINMGKAGKDFVFSEDDTVIATLDKSGRLRLWDVQELVHESNATAGVIAPIEIKNNILTFATAPPSARCWPTSVLFVDKARAYIKGYAQRYVVVGMKQNHTLQLWDLALGKAVQELNFPHEKESDPICSIAYHPPSGVIVVGHPTRNSIYLLSLSAPKYGLQGMSQAKYIQRLANQDTTLPKPESTAIMSGMREYSFASKGQLRSLDLLPITVEAAVEREERGLFELYVMHSKGVTCLNICKADLGWDEGSHVIISRNAEEAGYIVVRELREISQTNISEHSSVNGETIASTPGKSQHKTKKTTESSSKPPDTQQEPEQTGGTMPAQERPEKRRKKRGGNSTEEPVNVPPPAPIPPSASPAVVSRALSSTSVSQVKDIKSRKHSTSDLLDTSTEPKSKRSTISGMESISLGVSPDFMDRELKKVQDAVSTEFSTALNQQLESMRLKVRDDYVAMDTAAKERQVEVLRLVSEQLGGNVEKALSRIVISNITQSVIPSIHSVTTTTLRNEVPDWLSKHLLQTLPAQLKLALPEAVAKSIQSQDVLKFMSDQITSKISSHVEKQFSNTLHNSIIPAFQTMIVDSVQKKVLETEKRINEQVRAVNIQHEQTVAKIDQLTHLVKAFTETVHSMAASQAQFQSEILKNQLRSSHGREQSTASAAPPSDVTSTTQTQPAEMTPEQREIEAIDKAMNDGNYEQAVITWLQSSYQVGLFDNYFVRWNPSFLQGCSTLVVLSASAALTVELQNTIAERLEWLAQILEFVDYNDPEIRGVAPKIMDVLCQRLELRFQELSETNQLDPSLRKFPPLTRRAREIATLCQRA